MLDPKIVTVDETNIDQYPPLCFLNPKNEGYLIKREWILQRLSEGLVIKQLYIPGDKKGIGFIEYIPGENAWRAVDAQGYLFIHCIWISPNKNKKKGYGSLLVNECIEDAKNAGKYGVAVVTSEGPFMAGMDLFLKNGFKPVAQAKPSYHLMARSLKKGPSPKFRDWENRLSEYQGLHLIYTNQCPWVARSINELSAVVKENGLILNVTELKTAEQAQNAPSVYATFNLVHNGKLIVDHYISARRFQNIIDKELR